MKLGVILRVILIMAGTLSVAACGGGGGGGDSPPSAPVLSLTVQSIKTFHFTWAASAGATEYRLLENPDSSTGYTAVTTLPATATSYDHVVFLPGRINASYILRACNSQGCTDSAPVHVTGNLSSGVGYFKRFNNEEGGSFGYSVALSADGNTLAVGALDKPDEVQLPGSQPDNSTLYSGAVYVYTRSGTTWSQQAFLKASNADAADQFGYSVALSADGNTLAVGAIGESSNATGINGNQADNSAPGSGAVYVYTRNSATWSQQAYVKASNADAADQFGYSVALSADGNTLAVGAIGESSNATGINGNQADNSAPGSGAVYVYTRNGATWSQQTYVKGSDTEQEGFGWSAALSADGNTLAVGAVFRGVVYVYTRTGTTWSQQGYVKASNTEEGDAFGHSIALSADGNTLAVGAIDERSNATGINGNQADNSGFAVGAAYVFTRTGATWSQQAYVKASNAGNWDLFGWNIALSADGNTLAVGAYWEAGNATGINGNQADNSVLYSGAVYVYTRTGATWSQQAYVKASNTDSGDQFGYSVALSADGNTLAVGAVGEAGNATGINGNQADNSARSTVYSGAVYLY